MPRLLVTGGPPHRTLPPPLIYLDPPRPVVVVIVILSRPFFFTRDSLYSRQRFCPHRAAATRFNLVHLIVVGFVGAFRNVRSYLGPTKTIDNAVTIAEDTHAPVPLC